MADLQQLQLLAEQAAQECDVESDWFHATLIESDAPISSSRKARRFIAAMTPQAALRLIAHKGVRPLCPDCGGFDADCPLRAQEEK